MGKESEPSRVCPLQFDYNVSWLIYYIYYVKMLRILWYILTYAVVKMQSVSQSVKTDNSDSVIFVFSTLHLTLHLCPFGLHSSLRLSAVARDNECT